MANETTPKTGNDSDIEQNKTIAALSYVSILFLIPLLGKKHSKFSQFHAKQGLILFLISFVCYLPVIGQLLALVLIVVSIMGILKCLEGAWWKIPYIYDYSKKINL
jgi:uncharacterized membrane protein